MAGRNSYDLTVERGIRQRHALSCPANRGKRCTCAPRAFIASATVDGTRRYSPTVRSIDAARAWRLAAITNGLDPESASPGPSVRDGWRQWLRDAENGVALTRGGTPYRQTTVEDYDNAMRSNVLDQIGELPLDRLDGPTAQRILDAAANAGVKASRLHSTATALRALTRWAARRGQGSRVRELDLPRVETRKPVVLSPCEVRSVLDLITERSPKTAHAIAAYTGARALEVMALHREDVDLELRVIRLGEREARKTEAGLRTVPIVGPLMEIMSAADLPATGRLFGNALPRSIYSVYRRKAASAWAGLEPRPTLHTLRHNWISWLLAAGVPLPSVQVLSGHKTPLAPGVTLAVYGHATTDHVARARETMDAWLGQS